MPKPCRRSPSRRPARRGVRFVIVLFGSMSTCRPVVSFTIKMRSRSRTINCRALTSTTTVRHRWRLARLPAASPCSASAAPVHGQFALHGVVPRFCSHPHPRAGHVADDRLPASMHVDVLYGHLLLPFATMAIESVQQRGVSSRKLVGLVQILAPTFKGLLAKTTYVRMSICMRSCLIALSVSSAGKKRS